MQNTFRSFAFGNKILKKKQNPKPNDYLLFIKELRPSINPTDSESTVDIVSEIFELDGNHVDVRSSSTYSLQAQRASTASVSAPFDIDADLSDWMELNRDNKTEPRRSQYGRYYNSVDSNQDDRSEISLVDDMSLDPESQERMRTSEDDVSYPSDSTENEDGDGDIGSTDLSVYNDNHKCIETSVLPAPSTRKSNSSVWIQTQRGSVVRSVRNVFLRRIDFVIQSNHNETTKRISRRLVLGNSVNNNNPESQIQNVNPNHTNQEGQLGPFHHSKSSAPTKAPNQQPKRSSAVVFTSPY